VKEAHERKLAEQQNGGASSSSASSSSVPVKRPSVYEPPKYLNLDPNIAVQARGQPLYADKDTADKAAVSRCELPAAIMPSPECVASNMCHLTNTMGENHKSQPPVGSKFYQPLVPHNEYFARAGSMRPGSAMVTQVTRTGAEMAPPLVGFEFNPMRDVSNIHIGVLDSLLSGLSADHRAVPDAANVLG